MSIEFDGCRFGVCDDKSQPLKKPWRLMTTSKDIVDSFQGLFYPHKPEEHGEGRGKALERTSFYTQPMCDLVANDHQPYKVGQVPVPALTLIPIQHDSTIGKRTRKCHMPAITGLTELAAVIETDEEGKQLIEHLVDLNALISEIVDLPKDPASAEVTVMVTISWGEILSSPEALAAVRAQADGLIRAVPTQDEDSPREFEDVGSGSRKSGVKVYFSKLMTIASIKFYELAKHLQKMKGRIVDRGLCQG